MDALKREKKYSKQDWKISITSVTSRVRERKKTCNNSNPTGKFLFHDEYKSRTAKEPESVRH